MTKLIYNTTSADVNLTVRQILKNRRYCSNQFLKNVRLHGFCTWNGQFSRLNETVKSAGELIADDGLTYGLSLNNVPDAPILFENEHFVVLNKPAGMITHPTMYHGSNTLTDLLSCAKLHPVTRLDRHTSGAIIIAKNSYAHYALTANAIDKKYLALVHGRFTPQQGIIDAPIGRSRFNYMTRVVRRTGKPSVTHYNEIAYDAEFNISLVAFKLETGRTHQIRVHSLYYGHPLLGDSMYGLRKCLSAYPGGGRIKFEYSWDAQCLWQTEQYLLNKRIKRQALHAYEMKFTNPLTDERCQILAPLPQDMLSIIDSSATLQHGLANLNSKQV